MQILCRETLSSRAAMKKGIVVEQEIFIFLEKHFYGRVRNYHKVGGFSNANLLPYGPKSEVLNGSCWLSYGHQQGGLPHSFRGL